jgi:hypothetical protein
MTEYTDFVSSLSLEQQYKMPLTEEDIESYNKLIDNFLNYTVAGLELFPIIYTNIKSNSLEFSNRLKATSELESPSLSRARQKLALAIPLMRAKDVEIAKLLEENLSEIISFFREHDTQFEFGLYEKQDHLTPAQEAIDDAKRRLRGVNSDAEQFIINLGAKNIADNLRKRPMDQKTPIEIDLIHSHIQDIFKGKAQKDPYTKNLDNLLSASLQKMQEDKTQLEMSKTKAIELSNYKKQTKLKEADAKRDRMNSAVDVLVQACKKRNKGEN